MSWDPFLMKKLIKNEICVSVNSTQIYCSRRKVNICGYCSCTVHWTVTAFLPKRVKKKKKKKNENTASPKRRRSLSAIQTSTNSNAFIKKKKGKSKKKKMVLWIPRKITKRILDGNGINFKSFFFFLGHVFTFSVLIIE